MKHLIKATMLVAALGLAACTDPARFGSGGGGGADAGAGIGQFGDPSDPSSIAYFNQSIGDRVLFAVDQSTLDDEARITLNGQVDWLNVNPEYTVRIEGHADEQGTREYNLALGARRANAVQEYLISQGVAANRLHTVSYGKERPLEICSDESCYRQNRRSVSVVTAGIPSS